MKPIISIRSLEQPEGFKKVNGFTPVYLVALVIDPSRPPLELSFANLDDAVAFVSEVQRNGLQSFIQPVQDE